MSVERPHLSGAAELHERVEHLESALETRGGIARAQGILMERYGVDADAAIAILKRLSNELNVAVRDISRYLVETRRLPTREDAG